MKCKEHQKAGLREGIAPNLSTQSGAKGIDLVWKPRNFWGFIFSTCKAESKQCWNQWYSYGILQYHPYHNIKKSVIEEDRYHSNINYLGVFWTSLSGVIIRESVVRYNIHQDKYSSTFFKNSFVSIGLVIGPSQPASRIFPSSSFMA